MKIKKFLYLNINCSFFQIKFKYACEIKQYITQCFGKRKNTEYFLVNSRLTITLNEKF